MTRSVMTTWKCMILAAVVAALAGALPARAGTFVLSTYDEAGLGGLTFQDEDLVDYDPVTDTATMVFDGSALFTDGGAEDIDAVHVLPNGPPRLFLEGRRFTKNCSALHGITRSLYTGGR